MNIKAVMLLLGGSLLLAGCNTSVYVPPEQGPRPVVIRPQPDRGPIIVRPPRDPSPIVVRPPRGRCDARNARFVIGERAVGRVVRDAQNASGARTVRVIRPGEFTTRDYRADRLNIEVNNRDRIRNLSCG
ncbi:I78 family peptidase inhibitor [Methylobrevis pamukkalensis]|uniref:I78 family peptidase inhibitor n=1 Tax=Methylobrevis pamukkalensis TaxID=1439726 RepID=UPI000845C9EF|nr:I78 family peptidase inhibitor [Methylobrevis pamukkalensis]